MKEREETKHVQKSVTNSVTNEKCDSNIINKTNKRKLNLLLVLIICVIIFILIFTFQLSAQIILLRSYGLFKYWVRYTTNGPWQDEKTEINKLCEGDHIFVPGSISPPVKARAAFYHHHGIYLGKENGIDWVADFGAVSKEKPEKRQLKDFIGPNGNNMLYLRRYLMPTMPISWTLDLFKKIEEGEVVWNFYNLFINNCENFCTFLKTGITFSSQVYKIMHVFPLSALYFSFVKMKKYQRFIENYYVSKFYSDLFTCLKYTFEQYAYLNATEYT